LGKKNPQKEEENQSPFMPKKKDPIEIEFVKNFTQHGGRFLFIEHTNDLFGNFQNILSENTWEQQHVSCLHADLANHFGIKTSDNYSPEKHKVLLTTCESLIANKGSFLVCKHQIKNIKVDALPDYIIVFATLSQLTTDVSAAMSKLKQKYYGALPTNITNISVKDESADNTSLYHGRNAKNIYLLLQE
jgi:hypothetical protein